MRKASIYRSLTIKVIAPVVIVLLVIEMLNYFNTRKILQDTAREKSKIITEEIKSIREFQDASLAIIEMRMEERMREISSKLVFEQFSNTAAIEFYDLKKLRTQLGMDPDFEDLYIINENGIVISTTFDQDLNLDFFSFGVEHKEYLLNILYGERFVCERFGIEQKTKRPKKYSYQPTTDGRFIIEIGMYSHEADKIIEFANTRLLQLSQALENIKSIDLFIAADKPFSLNDNIKLTAQEERLLKDIVINKTKLTEIESEENSNIVTEYIYTDERPDGLYKGSVIRIITDKTHEKTTLRSKLINSIALSVLVGVIIIILVIRLIITNLISPLRHAIAVLQKLSKGDVFSPWTIENTQKDEVGTMIESINILMEMLRNTTNFAKKIGQGNWSVDYSMASESDDLGRALTEMRDNLKHLEEEKTQRDIEEEIRGWLTAGIAKFGDIVRQNSDNIQELADKVIVNLVRYLRANQCGFFILNDDNPNDEHLQLISTYAFDRRKYSEKRIELKEGYVGMCFLEQNTIYRTDIPEDYIYITSGLGSASPKVLLVVPLKIHNLVYGVIELASFRPFTDAQIEFTERVSENIASALHTFRNTKQARSIVRKMQVQADSFEHDKELMQQDIAKLENLLKQEQDLQKGLKREIDALRDQLSDAHQRIERIKDKRES